jgi:hypothetical protein
MDKRFDKLEEKIDKIVDKVGEINTTLAAQHVTLEEHIRRTELLEGEILPIKKHVTIVNAFMKLLGLLVAGGVVTEIVKFLIIRH